MSQSILAQMLQRASDALKRRGFGDATLACQQILARFGEEPNALMLLGAVRAENEDYAGAIPFYERARRAMPSHIHVLVNLGVAYRALGRLTDARAVLEEALTIDRRFAIAHNNLGNVLLALDDRAGAKRSYERAVALQANYAEPIASLARIAEEEHRLDDAERLASRALSLAPGNVSATLTSAKVNLRRGAIAEAATALEALLGGTGLTATNRVIAEGHLGDAYDKLGRFEAAFAAFARANAVQLEQHAASADGQGNVAPRAVAKFRTFLDEVDLSRWRAAPAAARVPNFLVGFPRSGTTLLDQVLASHPDVTTLEERDTLSDVVSVYLGGAQDLSRLPGLSAPEIENLRALYWRQVDAALPDGAKTRVFVDKLPLNAVFLPLIYRLFPSAKIILAVRDPRDCVLSCYQQRFGMNAAMYQLLRLETAAAYYDAVMDLVRASRAVLPLEVHEIKYEAVVGDFDGTIRSLLAFLELSWDEAVRNYAETAKKRAIGTPSATQVVKPIYTSAAGKWRNYRRFLEPVLPVLNPWVAAFGYEAS